MLVRLSLNRMQAIRDVMAWNVASGCFTSLHFASLCLVDITRLHSDGLLLRRGHGGSNRGVKDRARMADVECKGSDDDHARMESVSGMAAAYLRQGIKELTLLRAR